MKHFMIPVQMIEYTGELVRPSIADKRERLIYNSMVVRIFDFTNFRQFGSRRKIQ